MSQTQHYDKYVPHDGPEGASILIVGEAPGETEQDEGRPFVGPSGDLLFNCLARYGISRGDVRIANLCNYRPRGNDFKKLEGTTVLADGIRELGAYIRAHPPTVIVPLGSFPLKYLTGKIGIKKWRGSIIPYIADNSIKCIPTLHPAAVLRAREQYPIFDLDIRRIVGDASFPDFRLPEYRYIVNPRGLELEEWTQRLCDSDTLAVDIETVKRSRKILCVGFAPSAEVGVCILPEHFEGRRAIERILASDARKIFQFGLFDTTQLKLNGYQIRDPRAAGEGRAYYWDTLYAAHSVAPELPRSLEFLTSIYTRQPYYKTVGRGNIPDDEKGWSDKVDKQSLYEYNIKDCCCTFKIYEEQKAEMEASKPLRDTFEFVMQMIELQLHIGDSGLPIDMERRALLETALLSKWGKKQYMLNILTDFETNVRSPKLRKILYDSDKLGLPPRKNRDGNLDTSEDAIVSLIAYCQDRIESLKTEAAQKPWRIRLAACKLILEVRGLRQVLATYIVDKSKTNKVNRYSPDFRLRSTYKVGPETGRWSCTKYVDGSGINAQTMPRDPLDVDDGDLIMHKGALKMKEMLEEDELAELEQEEADNEDSTDD